ncbi:hypothetical protein [Melittangium boletus]|uniref:Uncharacterized protein n=1 Tax=Melittangium boletus DSM 14713 TaxID=1294270 RepID=A0A250IME9_9BACT|nr:hypothetical protein [Melittangium boletus]ATB32448.1 hypothetical protein MEBOL_005926 [Melittangium boletus DSM 14713]
MSLTHEDKARIHGMRSEQFQLYLERLEAERTSLLPQMSENNRPFLEKGFEARRKTFLQGLEALKNSSLRNFQPDEPIDVGALVQVRFIDAGKDDVEWRWVTAPTETDKPFSYEGTEIVFNRGGLGSGAMLIGRKAGTPMVVPGDSCSDADVKIEILAVL